MIINYFLNLHYILVMYLVILTEIFLIIVRFMKIAQNTSLIDAQSTLIYVQIVRHLDFSLAPLERIIFLRLCLSYRLLQDPEKNAHCIATQNIKEVAARIDIHYLKLKSALEVLVQKGLLEQAGEHQLQLCKSFRLGIKRTSPAVLTRHLPLKFFTTLFECLFLVRISHKQKKVQDLLKLNYQQWLVLFHLLWLSDSQGMVLEADTHTLMNYTGMSREALLRAITALFEYGILRGKVNGSLNHNFLRSVSAVYFLNLSHPIWGDNRLYADYYILSFPDNYQPIVQQAFDIIQNQFGQNEIKQDLAQCDIKMDVLQYHELEKIYQFKAGFLAQQLVSQYQLGVALDPKFGQYIQLLMSDFKRSVSKLNGVEDNLQRINLLLQRYWQQRQLNAQQIVLSAAILPDDKFPRWFNAYLRPLQLSAEAQAQAKKKQMNPISVQEALEDIRNQILLGIAQQVFQSELFPVLQQMLKMSFELLNPQHAWQLIQFSGFGQCLAQQQIYYVLQPKQQQDRFFLVEFVELEGSVQGYKLQCQALELNVDQQQKYGLLDSRFKAFTIQEEQSKKNLAE